MENSAKSTLVTIQLFSTVHYCNLTCKFTGKPCFSLCNKCDIIQRRTEMNGENGTIGLNICSVINPFRFADELFECA